MPDLESHALDRRTERADLLSEESWVSIFELTNELAQLPSLVSSILHLDNEAASWRRHDQCCEVWHRSEFALKHEWGGSFQPYLLTQVYLIDQQLFRPWSSMWG